MKFKPRNDMVIVKRQDPEKLTPGGLVIPPLASETSCTAEVVAVGPGGYDSGHFIPTTDLAVGDIVLIGKYSGSEMIIDNEKYVMLHEVEILAKAV